MPSHMTATPLLLLLSLTPLIGSARGTDDVSPAYQNSYLYELGLLGGYPTQSFESFTGKAPRPNIIKDDDRCHDDSNYYIFVSPRGRYVEDLGPIILDSYGNLVWMDTAYGQAMGMDMQVYKGKNYATFWKGAANGTFGQGEYIMINENYELEYTVKAGAPLAGDLHEFNIIPNGTTALITVYDLRPADLSPWGTPHGWIYDGIFQEIDIETGRILFTWSAADHFNLTDSLQDPGAKGRSPATAWDFFHINSVDKDDHGNYIISSRYMCAVACISKDDGRVLWQLSGKANSFTDLSSGHATRTRWQHHARYHGHGLVSVFNNNAADSRLSGWQSSGMLVQLDLDNMTATLVQRYTAYHPILSGSQGSVQLDFDRQRAVIGWGHAPGYTEFTLDGQVLCETHIGPVRLQNFGWTKNYRAFKHHWSGRPKTQPTLVARPWKNKGYVSWNGDTTTHRWELRTTDGDPKDDAAEWTVLASVDRQGRFETEFDTTKALKWIQVHAYDAEGKHTTQSKAVESFVTTPVVPMASPMHQEVPWNPWIIFSGYAFWVLLVPAVMWYFRGRAAASFWTLRSMVAIRCRSVAEIKTNFVASWKGRHRAEYEAVPLVAQDREDV